MGAPPEGFAGIDTSVPNIARMQDYYLGGTNNFAADRAAAEQVLRLIPSIRAAAMENREFLRVAVRYLAGQAGITQFIDIGTGLPANGAVHEVAQAVSRGVRVAYVDYDPAVIAHAGALLSGDDSAIAVLGDLRHARRPARPDLEIRERPRLRAAGRGAPAGDLALRRRRLHPRNHRGPSRRACPGSYVVITHIGGYVTRRTTAEEGDAALRVYAAAGHRPSPAPRWSSPGSWTALRLIDPVVMATAATPDKRDVASGEGVVGWRLVARKS